MSISNEVNIESNRTGCEEDLSKRLELGSEKVSNTSTLQQLPLEILEMVGKHLQEDPKDLKTFFETARRFQYSVLNIIHLQAIKELQVLKEINPSKPANPTSVIDFYQDFLAKIQDPNFDLRNQGVKIKDQKLQELQLQLTALATNQVVERTIALKQECQNEIMGRASFESIDDKYSNIKCALVSEALELIISSSVNPKAVRGEAVINAAKKGYFSIVKALLADGALILESQISDVLALAEQNGHLDVVMPLLANGQISEGSRGQAVILAATSRNLEVVEALLANGAKISEGSRGQAVYISAKNNCLGIVQALLANGEISEVQRGWAVKEAAHNGNLEVVKDLLASGKISKLWKSEAIKLASEGGHHSVAAFIDKNSDKSCSVM